MSQKTNDFCYWHIRLARRDLSTSLSAFGRLWEAGARTDELGYYAVDNPVHVHDVHATLLHLFGIDHKRLTYKFQGRDFRLTDTAGNVIKAILA
ncbi:MAG TPA: DUF1501 domain-containing protein [Fuerstia sp.]|nr:DUF1501 domain-containing protein [Fuerstiella sp.]